MLSVSLIRCANEALKKLHLKSSITCLQVLQRSKNRQVIGVILLISPHRLLC